MRFIISALSFIYAVSGSAVVSPTAGVQDSNNHELASIKRAVSAHEPDTWTLIGDPDLKFHILFDKVLAAELLNEDEYTQVSKQDFVDTWTKIGSNTAEVEMPASQALGQLVAYTCLAAMSDESMGRILQPLIEDSFDPQDKTFFCNLITMNQNEEPYARFRAFFGCQ
jgi:hypothetical protein